MTKQKWKTLSQNELYWIVEAMKLELDGISFKKINEKCGSLEFSISHQLLKHLKEIKTWR